MNQAQKKARFEELGLRIKIMRARQQGRVDLASMEALRTMSSEAAKSLAKDRDLFTHEMNQATELAAFLTTEASMMERRFDHMYTKYPHAFEIDGEQYDDEVYTLVNDMKDLSKRLIEKRHIIAKDRSQLRQVYGPTVESVNAIVLTGKLSVQENHELINMVNEHHDLKEELGLR